MNRDNVIRLAELLSPSTAPIDSRDWVTIPCPMANIRHSSGTDRKPSFGIGVNDGGISYWNCFSCCPEYRPLYGLVPFLSRAMASYPHEIARFILHNELAVEHDLTEIPDAVDLWISRERKPDVQVPDCLPEKALKKFPELAAYSPEAVKDYRKFLFSRGIPEEAWTQFGVRFFVGRPFIVFPFTDLYGRICVLRVRGIKEKELFTVSPSVAKMEKAVFPTLKTSGAWFGLPLVDLTRPVIIVEGELDAMRLYALGYTNVVAPGGKHIHKSQMDVLTAPAVFFGLDSDVAGRTATSKLVRAYKADRCITVLDWSVSGAKDPGELPSREAAMDVFKQAKIVS